MSSFESMDLQGIDLNLLLAFDALFTARTVTGAARRLRVGQPAASAALARLRRIFQDELFVRSRGAMTPTPLAISAAEHVARALGEARRAFDIGETFDPATAARSFTVASTDYTSYVILPPILAALHREAPGIDLRVIGYDKDMLAVMIERAEVDVAFGVFPKPPGSAVVQRLFEERFVGIARRGHPALVRGRVSLASFVRTPHALATMRRDAVGNVDEALARRGMSRRVALTVPHHLLLRTVVESSDMLAAVPARLAKSMRDGGLTTFALPLPPSPWTVSMMWPEVLRRDRANAWFRALIVRSVSERRRRG